MSIRNKFRIWPLVITVIFLGLGIGVYFISTNLTKKLLQRELFNTLQISLAAVNPERIKSLANAPVDASSADYARVKDQLHRLGQVFTNRGIDSIYIVGLKDNNLLFLVDSLLPTEARYSAPGSQYFEPPEEIMQIFQDGAYKLVGPYTDEYGTFLSYFAPVKIFSTNEQVGVMGVDIDYDFYQAEIFKINAYSLSIVFILYLFSLILWLYFSNRSRTFRKLYESEGKINAIAKATIDGICMTNHAGQIIFWNTAAEKLFGYSVKEVMNKNISTIVPNYDSKFLMSTLLSSEKKFRTYSTSNLVEFKTESKTGKTVIIEMSIAKIEIKEEIFVVNVFRDVTKRKKIEDERTKLNRYMVGRELKMIELKKEIKNLKEKNENKN